MGVSHIVDPDGNLLWSPTSLEGSYTVEKTQSVAEILRDLMSELTLNTIISIDDSNLSNVYTKDQVDEKFVSTTGFEATLESKILSYVTDGTISGNASLTELSSKVLRLYKTCYGTDLEDNVVQADSYNSRIVTLESHDSAHNNYLLHIMSDIYETDGSEVNMSVKLFSMVSDTGKSSDLSSTIPTDSRQSLAKAINYVNSQVSSIFSQASSASSMASRAESTASNAASVASAASTTASNAMSTASAASSAASSVSTTIGSFSSIDAGLRGDATSLVGVLNNISQQLSDLERRVSALEQG